jgi:hypothetical protein
MSDSANCKENVWHASGNWGHSSQCSRKAKRDGYCTQHHPDSVKIRRAGSQAKYDKDWTIRGLLRKLHSIETVQKLARLSLCMHCEETLERGAANLRAEIAKLNAK